MTTFKFMAIANTKTHKAGGTPTTPNRQGKLPIQFSVIAGTAPNRAIVLDGSVGETLKIEAGCTYLLQATFKENNEYGDNYTIVNRGTVSIMESLTVEEALGTPNVVQTTNGKIVSQIVKETPEFAKAGEGNGMN